jgi:hypothetical protein
MGSLSLGYSAEMSLSRNGAKLFVSFADYDSEPKALKLAVVDTASGKIATSVENEGAMLWHVPPPASNIAAAPDGSRVFILKRRTRGPGSDDYAVVPFDARTGRFLTEDARRALLRRGAVRPRRGEGGSGLWRREPDHFPGRSRPA